MEKWEMLVGGLVFAVLLLGLVLELRAVRGALEEIRSELRQGRKRNPSEASPSDLGGRTL